MLPNKQAVLKDLDTLLWRISLKDLDAVSATERVGGHHSTYRGVGVLGLSARGLDREELRKFRFCKPLRVRAADLAVMRRLAPRIIKIPDYACQRAFAGYSNAVNHDGRGSRRAIARWARVMFGNLIDLN